MTQRQPRATRDYLRKLCRGTGYVVAFDDQWQVVCRHGHIYVDRGLVASFRRRDPRSTVGGPTAGGSRRGRRFWIAIDPIAPSPAERLRTAAAATAGTSGRVKDPRKIGVKMSPVFLGPRRAEKTTPEPSRRDPTRFAKSSPVISGAFLCEARDPIFQRHLGHGQPQHFAHGPRQPSISRGVPLHVRHVSKADQFSRQLKADVKANVTSGLSKPNSGKATLATPCVSIERRRPARVLACRRWASLWGRPRNVDPVLQVFDLHDWLLLWGDQSAKLCRRVALVDGSAEDWPEFGNPHVVFRRFRVV